MEWISHLEQLKIAVVIPSYNNAGTIVDVVEKVLAYSGRVIVVDDGSTDQTRQIIERIPAVQLVTYPVNRGKGYALRKGLQAAAESGAYYALTLDADGQHYPDDIPVFIREIEQYPDSLLVGSRNLSSENMPGKNSFANRFSNFWFRLETGISLQDTQSGFRIYPLEKLKGLRFVTCKYEFELEVIVRAAWKGIDVRNVPIRVYYPPREERISHFRPFRDFARISVLNTVLVLIAFLGYWPFHFIHRCTRENVRRFIRQHITHSGESNLRITLAIMLGLFMGIVPVWGYQMILAVVLSHLMKLNKVIALVFSNISVPPVIPFLLYGSYVTGGWLLGLPLTLQLHDISFTVLKESLWQYLVGSVCLAIGCSLAGGVLAFTLLTLFRKNEYTNEPDSDSHI